jgi:hypothetical protein
MVPSETHGDLATAIQDADSPAWSVRASAGRRLAASAETPGTSGILRRLLLDAQDTGVTHETAEALLERQDVHGLRTVLGALARAQETSTADQLSAAVDCDPRWMTDDGADQLVHQLRELASDEDAGVREESQRLLDSLRRSHK